MVVSSIAAAAVVVVVCLLCFSLTLVIEQHDHSQPAERKACTIYFELATLPPPPIGTHVNHQVTLHTQAELPAVGDALKGCGLRGRTAPPALHQSARKPAFPELGARWLPIYSLEEQLMQHWTEITQTSRH